MTTVLWGAETARAIENFPISGEPVPAPVIHWLGRIKAASARVNGELGLIDADRAARIAAAADRVAAGELDDQFPVDVFQTGSGTSTHMNANEVIARLAGDDVHANDHVNVCQSSNCVFPTAVHLAAAEQVAGPLTASLDALAAALEAKAAAFADVAKAGRTHLMDAVPVTVGQELAGYAAQVRQGVARLADALPRLCQVPLGGTATGSGLNVHPEFAERARRLLADGSGLPVAAPAHPFEATGARDALVEASGALRVVAVSLYKIANDLRWLASGPRTGLGELVLPELQKGSTMMPGKVNPVIPEAVTQVAAQVIGNDAAVAFAGTQGQLELNAFAPVMARNLLHSTLLLTRAAEVFRSRCIEGLEVDAERCRRSAERTLAAGTSLNPLLGYDLVGEVVRDAWRTDRTLREVLEERGLASDEALAAIDPRRAAAGGILS